MGCHPNGTVKAMFGYSRDAFVAYWSEEKLDGVNYEIVNGKRLHRGGAGSECVDAIKRRLCLGCRGGIGTPVVEGCSDGWRKRN